MARKRERTTDVPLGTLVPQPGGGALKVGNPGNKGGPGRPPNKLRQELRGLLDEAGLVELRRRFSPEEIQKISHQDLCRYLDTLGKYGIGTKQEISGPDDGPLSHGVLLIPGAAPAQEEDEEPSS
jgi:hypothetical protein